MTREADPRTEAIARIYEGFRAERREALERVRDWIGAVVWGGNWGFSDPEAVAQDVLLRLFDIVRAGKVNEPAAFQKFVHRVAKHTCVACYHKERRRAAHESPGALAEDPPVEVDPGASLDRRDRLDALSYILQQLPEACRQIWGAVYADRRPAEEVAEELGITVNNLRVRAHRCLDRARRIYRDYNGWPASDPGAGS